jgi:hypothetical protein
MKRFLLSIAVIAAMLFGSLAVPSTAEARPWRGGYGYYGPRAYSGYGYGYRPYYYGNYGGYNRAYYGGYYAPRYYYGYPGYYGGYYGSPYYRYGGYGYGYYPGLRAGVYVY